MAVVLLRPLMTKARSKIQLSPDPSIRSAQPQSVRLTAVLLPLRVPQPIATVAVPTLPHGARASRLAAGDRAWEAVVVAALPRVPPTGERPPPPLPRPPCRRLPFLPSGHSIHTVAPPLLEFFSYAYRKRNPEFLFRAPVKGRSQGAHQNGNPHGVSPRDVVPFVERGKNRVPDHFRGYRRVVGRSVKRQGGKIENDRHGGTGDDRV